MSDESAAAARLNAAHALRKQGQIDEAIAAYRSVGGVGAIAAEASNGLGIALMRLRRCDEALAAFRAAVAVWPDYAEAYNNLGNVLDEMGRRDEAAAAFRAALRAKPGYLKAYTNLAETLRLAGKPNEAEAALRTALTLWPNDVTALVNLGALLADMNRFDEALIPLDAAVARRPDLSATHANRGGTLMLLGRLAEAETSLNAALALSPDHPEALANLGSVLALRGKHGEAEAAFRRAIALRPDFAEAHAALGETLLSRGAFAEGWREFEWRWKAEGWFLRVQDFAGPQWNGEPPAGRTVLLYHEQGLGDTIQFARYATRIAALGARAILEVSPPLARLMATVPGVSQAVATGQVLPRYDFHLPLMNAPRIFATELATIPADVPYVSAEPADVARWRDRLGRLPGRKVGIVWAGDPRAGNPRWTVVDARRSVGLKRFAPILDVPGVSFVSLQKGAGAKQLAEVALPNPPLDVMDEVRDFADTAAIVANLDLVIAVDTSVAHLAGALGKPVWILSRFDGDWRWLRDRDDSPWYPTARLFRQTEPGAWEPVIARVRAALQSWAK